ncbi:hypothetical protein CQA38_03625 [Campylobacter sp. MIT 12-5580]|uniref:class I SAM-dependent methyltransferase n=1 Tax=Campylobacter sp. MIT 12-5580 TaxID=2040651 RepID=UPI0010F9BC0A|nr:class I SAM-dependent methyltransferase [Campylobacter sp. MIT 12-5580]TKX29187.1 hypothetical protein CQA38_03625 [Campylobacter sp. MIT 12-5580]
MSETILSQYSEMHISQREFIIKEIQRYKPKKILELGIAAGANSVLVLKYLEENELLDEVRLHSVDFSTFYYRDLNDLNMMKNPRLSGFLVDELVPHLRKYWNLYTPGLVAKHLDEIGKDIDFVILDTAHSLPGELLDFLMILPYLSKNAVICMDDLMFHVWYNKQGIVCNLLYLLFKGEKTLPCDSFNRPFFQNVGSCMLADGQLEHINLLTFFKALTIPWVYMPNIDDLEIFKQHILRHYGMKYVEAFEEIVKIQEKWFRESENQRQEYLKQQIEFSNSLKIKEHLSYKLGQALIKAYNNRWGGAYQNAI